MAKRRNLSYQDIESALMAFKTGQARGMDVAYQILKAFGKSDADIRRYSEGKGVVARYDGLLIKGLLAFKAAATTRLTDELEDMKGDDRVLKAAPKIMAVSDGATILAYDTREKESYENPLDRLYRDFAFFYPLCGVERSHGVDESPADVKAAERLAKLHDELRAYNEPGGKGEPLDLDIFIARLLFCLFAEDTGIFEENLFTGSIARYTKEDGSDLADYLDAAFNVMDQRERNADTPGIIAQFPYVNGGLFSKRIRIPRMGPRARKIILECGGMDWKDINPDIFGSMIQAVVDPDARARQGMHYTSVPNIMKVISPLFLDELRGAYNSLRDLYERKKRQYDIGGLTRARYDKDVAEVRRDCRRLLGRMSRMKFLDPACGSGNFLVIAYKSLRMLEMDIARLMRRIVPEIDFCDSSVVRLSQFYGIELLDFPHEVAMLSLWLAERQMDRKFHDAFGVDTEALPLPNITRIARGNACRMDWEEVCPRAADEEVFVFGNPPYVGSKLQSAGQKEDISIAFGPLKNSKILDYISIWFYYASRFIKGTKAKFAFVSTNSICQGEQVSVLWPEILANQQEIIFAYKPFKWSNNAKYNAGVTVTIVGVANESEGKKYLYDGERRVETDQISPYLSAGSRAIVSKENKTPDGLPRITFGSMPYDNGFLLLGPYEYERFKEDHPGDLRFIRRIYGSEEFINGKDRYCLWIDDKDLDEAMENPFIADRIEKTRQSRLRSKDESGRKLAERAHQFREHPVLSPCIIIPAVSSERRDYIPMGYLNAGTVVSNLAFAIYGAELWFFGILTSRMHMAWAHAVGGRLGTSYRYSAQLCYNPFPFPETDGERRRALGEAAEGVLLTRADYPGMTLAELYDPGKMPAPLREAHRALDEMVDSCYPGHPFASDEARLECLFKSYERMAALRAREATSRHKKKESS